MPTRKPSNIDSISYYFSFVMIVVYLGLGSVFLFTNLGVETFHTYRKEMGLVVICYAIVRIVLTRAKMKRQKDSFNEV